MNQPTARRILRFVAPVGVLAAAIIPFAAYRSRLPGQVASHWNPRGVADGAMSFTALFVVSLAVALVAAWLSIMAAARPGSDRVMFGASVTMFLAATAGGLLILTARVNLHRSPWQMVPGPALWMIAVALIVAGAAAWLVATAAARLRPVTEVVPRDLALPGVAGEKVMWTQQIFCRWFLIAGLVCGVGAVFSAIRPVDGAAMLLPGLLVFLGLTFVVMSSVSVRADDGGLHLAYGPMHWPRQRIVLSRIAAAEAIDLRPTQWGGWGYRGSLRIFKRAAVVLRGGPGLRLDLRNGARFAVSIDDPATGAAVLNRAITLRP
jgi:Protein of unknown function (DUF1648)